MPPATLWRRINELLVDASIFSEVACLDGRMFGVHTFCEGCQDNITTCARRHLIEGLLAAQDLTEKKLGVNLTTRYHEVEIPISSCGRQDEFRYLTDWPGIAAVNVRQQINVIADLEAQVSPYLEEGISGTDSGLGFCYITINGDLLDSPNFMRILDENNKVISQYNGQGFPRRNVDGDWEIALVVNLGLPDCIFDLKIQHCRYVYVDVDAECLTGTLTPIYPGTTMFIPQAKPSELLEGGGTRFWFNPWVFASAVYDDADWENLNELYKFDFRVAFACVEEVEALPEFTCSRTCTCQQTVVVTDEDAPQVEVTFEQPNVIKICVNKNPCGCSCGRSLTSIKVYYKTSPLALGHEDFIYSLRRAISYYVAASLPLDQCGCKVQNQGFIAQAQVPYTDVKINPVTGQMVEVVKYGNKYGQLMFAEILLTAPKFHKLIKA